MLAGGCQAAHPPTPSDHRPALTSTEHKQKLENAKNLFFSAVGGQREDIAPCIELLDQLGGGNSSDPEVVAYRGAVELLKAAHSPWWEKASLAKGGLALEDRAVAEAPDNLEVRFLRGVTNYELPRFMNRWDTARSDLEAVAKNTGPAVADGRLDPRAAAANLDYYGKVLEGEYQIPGAVAAWREAVRLDPTGVGGRDARKHLREHNEI